MMRHHTCQRNPIISLFLQQIRYQILGTGRYVLGPDEIQIFNFFTQLLIQEWKKRGIANQEFITNYSQTPVIHVLVVFSRVQNLRCQIPQGAAIGFPLSAESVYRPPEISQFQISTIRQK